LIDTDAFSSALSAGDLDACLELLRSCDSSTSDTAVLHCRLAEALFHHERRDEALECGRRAFALTPDNPETAHFCAWLFSRRIEIRTTLGFAL
jgi:Flp pilus assembly protein TadD